MVNHAIKIINVAHLGILLLLLSGCSLFSSSGEVEPPQVLPKVHNPALSAKLQWTRKVGEPTEDPWIYPNFALDGDFLYVSDVKGHILKLGKKRGGVIWKKNLKINISSGIGVASEVVLFGTLKGKL